MSRSNNADLQNPAKKRFEWSGSEGKIKCYDSENKKNVYYELPFMFLVLDKLSTIAGFYEKEQSGFWSNEIRNTKTDLLTVRTKKGVEQEALYADLAPTLNKGAKYAQSVYIAYKEGDKLEIANLKIFGSALGTWIDFCKDNDIYKVAVSISGATPAKKGATKYFVPVYEAKAVTDETNKQAALLDVELQAYLNGYLASQGTPSAKKNVAHETSKDNITPENGNTKAYAGDEPAKDGKHYGLASPPTDDLPFRTLIFSNIHT